MKRVVASPAWPESWKLSYHYDRMEIYGEQAREGYAYAYERRRTLTLETVRGLLTPGSRILDVAAAQGNFTLALAEDGYEVTWNDLREELADYVRLKHSSGQVQYLPGNVLEIRPPHLFDAILLTEVIEHVAHPDVFLRSVAAHLRPEGWLILTTPNGGYFRNRLPSFSDCVDPSQFEEIQFRPDADGHIFLLHDDEILRLAEAAGLQPCVLRHFGNPLTNGHVKLRHVLPLLPPRFVEACERLGDHLPSSLSRRFHFGTLAVFRKLATARGH
jgi:2-polyprenyl-6-hydroxyphenyl methylase/3-demethylubiquinone-9 3-methyltransferase